MEIDKAIAELKSKEKSIRFSRLVTICETFFGAPRINGAHHVFTTGMPEQPLLNLQSDKGKSKSYQVRQVREALERLQEEEQ